jgi:hypothetical protein
MTEPVRFPANVPYAKWPNLYAVFTAMSVGDFGEAEARWHAHTQDCLDAAGAIQQGYEQFAAPPSGAPDPQTIPTNPAVPFVANGGDTPTKKVMNEMPQGVLHAQVGKGRKKLSWTIGSGGYPCWLSFEPTFPNDPAKTTGAVGGTPWLNSPDGDWTAYLFYPADPGRVQKATLDIAAV